MPPAWVRRPLTVSAWLGVAVLGVALSPLLLGLAWIAGKLTGRPQVLIFARLIVAYLLAELAVLIGCGLLWLLSAGGRVMHQRRFQLLHWRLLRWFARRIATATVSVLSIDVAPDPSPDATRALQAGDPVLIFSRHAGPGDSILLVDQLLTRFHRRASVVLKGSWAVDPSVDLLAHRLPQALLEGGDREDAQAQIADVASRLGAGGGAVAVSRRRQLHAGASPLSAGKLASQGPTASHRRSTAHVERHATLPRRRARSTARQSGCRRDLRRPHRTRPRCHSPGALARHADGKDASHAYVAGPPVGDTGRPRRAGRLAQRMVAANRCLD